MTETSQAIAGRAQHSLLDAIPTPWRLSQTTAMTNQSDGLAVIVTSELPRPQQKASTERDALELLEDLASGQLTSLEVTEAFLIRAAHAHQLVNCLVGFRPDMAMARARSLTWLSNKSDRCLAHFSGAITIRTISRTGRYASRHSLRPSALLI